MGEFVAIPVLSFLVALATTPFVIWFSNKINFLDQPDGSLKPQDRPIPNLGGVAIFLGLVCALFFGAYMGNIYWKTIYSILIGATLLIVVGFLDDKFDIKGLKLAAHIGVGLLLGFMGLRFSFISDPVISIGLTALMVVITCNAINLIDGVDGLAGGITAIASIFFFILFFFSRKSAGMVIALGLLGGTTAFLIFNFNPASIYLGNSGSLLVGFLAAVMMIIYPTSQRPNLLAATLLVFAIPIADMVLAFVRRIINHRPFLAGDRSHFYDHLLKNGLSLRKVIFLIYFACTVLGILAIWASNASQIVGMLIFVSVCICFILIIKKMKFYTIID